MTLHKMAADARGWKQATVCGVSAGYPASISRFDRHITCHGLLWRMWGIWVDTRATAVDRAAYDHETE